MFDPNIRILVVDDMFTMRKLVVRALTGLGFSNFLQAEDGAKGWEQLTNSDVPVSLIISDWNMPNSTGMDLLRRVRSDGRTKQLPFILLTAEAEMHQVSEAVAAGVSGYIVKPLTPESLQAQLEKIHKKQAA